MRDVKNPAKSRPLSANVRRLMRMARESPENPNVVKISRAFTERDIAYCDMQGNVFMAALDKGIPMHVFAPLYMNSQIAGIMDYSFSCAGGLENDETVLLLKVPLLVKSPDTIVDTMIWIDHIVANLQDEQSPSAAIMSACLSDAPTPTLPASRAPLAPPGEYDMDAPVKTMIDDIDTLADEYEYAYWLGYIYRCECLLHDESSRMVYGAFNEGIMRKTYDQMLESGIRDEELATCAGEICRRLDMMLIGKLWK